MECFLRCADTLGPASAAGFTLTTWFYSTATQAGTDAAAWRHQATVVSCPHMKRLAEGWLSFHLLYF